jgi:hypothetical protein
MEAVAVLLIGLVVSSVGLALVFDFRRLGSRLIADNTCLSAAPWSLNPKPRPEDVEDHRVAFGVGVALVGLVIAGVRCWV